MKREFWNSMLDADLNVRYWNYLSKDYHNRNLWVKVILVLTASGTVLSWFFTSNQLLWRWLSIGSALIAILHLFVDWEKKIQTMHFLEKEYRNIKNKYEMLWAEFKDKDKDEGKLKEQYRNIKEKETDISYMASEPDLPYNRKLILTCYQKVLRSRGLTNKTRRA